MSADKVVMAHQDKTSLFTKLQSLYGRPCQILLAEVFDAFEGGDDPNSTLIMFSFSTWNTGNSAQVVGQA